MSKQKNSTAKDHIAKGIALACAAFFFFTLMQVFNKLLTGTHHVVEIAVWRNIPPLLICAGYILATKQYHLLETKRPRMMTLRVLIGVIGLTLTFAAVQHLPMSDATVLFFASTLMVPVMAHFFLKEHIGQHRWIAIAIGLSGVIIAAQPTAQVTLIGIALALGAATTHGLVLIVLRAMKGEEPFTILFYFFLGGAILPAFFLPWIGSWPTIESFKLLLAIGITGGIGQFCLTRAMQIAPASVINPFAYTGLIWAIAFDIFIWKSVPGWPVFIGATIIMLSYLYILHREKIRRSQLDSQL